MLARIPRLSVALFLCALGALPTACSTGVGTLPGAPAGTRPIASGGTATTGGGGGGTKAPAPGALAFSSGCGAIDSVTNASAVTAGFPNMATITTKIAEHNCVPIFWTIDYVNTATGLVETTLTCFNFTTSPYTCQQKFKTAQLGATYEERILVWNAELAGESLATPIDPAWVLGTESVMTSTVGAAPNQGA